MTTVTLPVADARRLAERALTACGCSPANATSQARAVIEAERLGIVSHGFAYLPIYCGHLKAGKVDGQAVPELEALSDSAFRCDARDGFALPAMAWQPRPTFRPPRSRADAAPVLPPAITSRLLLPTAERNLEEMPGRCTN